MHNEIADSASSVYNTIASPLEHMPILVMHKWANCFTAFHCKCALTWLRFPEEHSLGRQITNPFAESTMDWSSHRWEYGPLIGPHIYKSEIHTLEERNCMTAMRALSVIIRIESFGCHNIVRFK